MSQGVRQEERVQHFYRVMTAIESRAEYDEGSGYTLTMRDFRCAVTEALCIVGRRSIGDWFNRCVDLGYIIKLGATGNLHYAKDAWRNSPIYREAKEHLMDAEFSSAGNVQLIDRGRSR